MGAERAEEYVRSLEPLGWRLGLERMHRLCSLLGMPQHRFRSVHVVGTNGKSSVARMTAALAAASGTASGAYLSPHLHSWRERILIGGEPIGAEPFAGAVERVRQAAEVADRAAGDDGPVTQFEFFTAVAFVAFAAAKVRFAAIEAGLGGRLDATNVIPSAATALTSVGLDHTDWLGETIAEIAGEKLAVLRPGTALVTGELSPEAAALAERTAAERGARLIAAPDPPAELAALVPPGYPRRNLAVAVALNDAAGNETPAPQELGAAELLGPGRMERIEGDPPAILDAAHNPDGARALAEALGAEGTAVACLAVLADKDAAGICDALAPALAAAVTTQVPEEAIAGSGRPGAATAPAGDLAAAMSAAGVEGEAEPDWEAALSRAGELARARGAPLVVCGSHYLVALARARLLS